MKHQVKDSSMGDAMFHPASFTSHTQRLHALLVKYPLFRTAYGSLEAILGAHGYPYSKSGNAACPMYELRLSQAVTLKITRSYINAYGPQLEAPLGTPTAILDSLAVRENAKIVSDFLTKTGIRAQRRLDGMLVAIVAYREVALTENELAGKVSAKHGYVKLAVDGTGKVIEWTDHSGSFELEGNDARVLEEARQWAQGIEDGELRPYQDAIDGKLNLQQLNGLISKVVPALADLTEKTSKLAEQNAITAKNEITHLPLLEKMNKIFDMWIGGEFPTKRQMARLRAEAPRQKKL